MSYPSAYYYRELYCKDKPEDMYSEILKLHEYCQKIGVESTLSDLFDGFALRFPDGSDFVQHRYSYGSRDGCVEPSIGSKSDYTAVSLESAKRLVRRNKSRLNGGGTT